MKKYLLFVFSAVIALIAIAATSINSGRLVSQLTVNEQLVSGQLDESINHTRLNEVVNFRQGTDYEASNVYSARLTTGTSIDLTSVTNTLGEAVDLTNERILAVKFKNSAETGTGVVNITQGATNPYPLFGSTFSIDLAPKQSILYNCDIALSGVSGTAFQIDYTLNSDTLEVLLITGDAS